MGNFLSREEILAIPLRTKEVEVPEWNTTILVEELSAQDDLEKGQLLLKSNGKVDFTKASQIPIHTIIKKALHPETKERLFLDSDRGKLIEKHGGAIARIFAAIQDFSGLQAKDYDKLATWLEENHPKVLEEYLEENSPVAKATENFTITRNGDSPSD